MFSNPKVYVDHIAALALMGGLIVVPNITGDLLYCQGDETAPGKSYLVQLPGIFGYAWVTCYAVGRIWRKSIEYIQETWPESWTQLPAAAAACALYLFVHYYVALNLFLMTIQLDGPDFLTECADIPDD